ncbi:MAG: hypothetical protein WBA99_08350 [Nodosilinea sp.]
MGFCFKDAYLHWRRCVPLYPEPPLLVQRLTGGVALCCRAIAKIHPYGQRSPAKETYDGTTARPTAIGHARV